LRGMQVKILDYVEKVFQLNVADVERPGEQVGGRRGIRRNSTTTVPLRRGFREGGHAESGRLL
jgi:hypothetical protein